MKKETAEQISQLFIDQLKQGTVPWRQPWTVAGILPHNYFSRRPYRGINSLILDLMQHAKGYESVAWTTYKAAAERGAQVRKGEKGTQIVFWKPIKVEDKETGKEKQSVIARLYTVFNTDQIDGIEWSMPDREPVEVRDALKQIVENYPNPPRITHTASSRAYYSPASDEITCPLLEQFDSEQGYAETILHECVHSTGHSSRLNRFENDKVGCKGEYAKEELVAEIGATMLMQQAGIQVDMPQMASYVGGWLKALEDDHTLIIKAAQTAQKAVDHILGQAPAIDSDN